VTIEHYHADNGCFADNAFMQSIAEYGQTISFCGVNAHFQNGIAEKCIGKHSEQAHKQLLHAKARWPEAIEINLWPYVIRNANDIHNTIADNEDGRAHLWNGSAAPTSVQNSVTIKPSVVQCMHYKIS
jgi:hypothetical protein